LAVTLLARSTALGESTFGAPPPSTRRSPLLRILTTAPEVLASTFTLPEASLSVSETFPPPITTA
jgi:hypothetical protein